MQWLSFYKNNVWFIIYWFSVNEWLSFIGFAVTAGWLGWYVVIHACVSTLLISCIRALRVWHLSYVYTHVLFHYISGGSAHVLLTRVCHLSCIMYQSACAGLGVNMLATPILLLCLFMVAHAYL